MGFCVVWVVRRAKSYYTGCSRRHLREIRPGWTDRIVVAANLLACPICV
jgi:hypothetical protein